MPVTHVWSRFGQMRAVTATFGRYSCWRVAVFLFAKKSWSRFTIIHVSIEVVVSMTIGCHNCHPLPLNFLRNLFYPVDKRSGTNSCSLRQSLLGGPRNIRNHHLKSHPGCTLTSSDIQNNSETVTFFYPQYTTYYPISRNFMTSEVRHLNHSWYLPPGHLQRRVRNPPMVGQVDSFFRYRI